MEPMGEKRPRRFRTARKSDAPRRLTLAWVLAGDRSGVFARSMAMGFLVAIAWMTVLTLADEHLAGDGAPGPVAERLLRELEESGSPAPSELVTHAPVTAPPAMRRAIMQAALKVGVAPAYLFAVAARESSFDAHAYVSRSSAAGLYQFTEATWLRVVKVFGARHGLGAYADAITLGEDGSVAMKPGPERTRLMRLRFDPHLASVMAAELARDNEHRLAHVLGRPVSPAETYIAHFLGLHQAARMITEAEAHPHVAAARVVPVAAAANPDVFRKTGKAASARALVREIEAYFRDEVPRFAPA